MQPSTSWSVRLALRVNRIVHYLSHDAFGGPRVLKLAWAINLQKAGTAPLIGADSQKNAVLRIRSGLIEDGFHSRTRHPNYLGEMAVYASCALMVRHWIQRVIRGSIWTFIFMTNIAAQEASRSRHPGWAASKARTGLLWPGSLTVR